MKIRKISKYRKFLTALGLPLCAAGLVFGILFLCQLFSWHGYNTGALFGLTLSFGGTGLLCMGLANYKRRMEDLYRRYLLIAGRAAYVPVRSFAAVTGRSKEKVRRELQDMADRGYFGPNAFIDASRMCLVINPYAPHPRNVDEEEYREPAASPKAAQQAAPPVPAQPPEKTVDNYLDMLGALHLINGRIRNDAMRDRILRIESIARAIFQAVEAKPEKRSQIQMFMNYYLPTTIKLLHTYVSFEQNTVTGANIEKSKASIEAITLTLADAFEKQFDSLFALDATDISVEIEVMENMLRRDGFMDDGLRMTMPGL